MGITMTWSTAIWPIVSWQSAKRLEVDKYFRALVKLEGSDLHLKVGQPPIVRVNGKLRPLNREPIELEEMCRLLFPMMNKRHRVIFDHDGGADFAHSVDVDGVTWRFRVNMLQQMGAIGLVARRVSNWIPDFSGLHLPPIMEDLCKYDQGMILLAGVTGSGKDDHHRFDAELDQRTLPQTHPDARRPDRVCVYGRQVPDQPTGGR